MLFRSLLQQLVLAEEELHLMISPSGAAVMSQELGLELGPHRNDLAAMLRYSWPCQQNGDKPARWHPFSEHQIASGLRLVHLHDYRNFFTPVASGSFLTRGMIICPCSGATLSGVVHAAGNNLIQRAADVHLKEHRKLILVPRETPLSVFQLENMTRAAQAGAVVMPAMPGWYHGVQSPVDLIDFVVARILDHLQIEHGLTKRWEGPSLDTSALHRQSGDE